MSLNFSFNLVQIGVDLAIICVGAPPASRQKPLSSDQIGIVFDAVDPSSNGALNPSPLQGSLNETCQAAAAAATRCSRSHAWNIRIAHSAVAESRRPLR